VQVAGVPGRDAGRLARARDLGLDTAHETWPETFAVVIECSGSEAGIDTGLLRARPGGRFVQIGLAGRPAAIQVDLVCYRELTMTSGNASTPRSWRRALELVRDHRVVLKALVSDVVPLAEWERAFAATREGSGIKVVLDPS
jgi:L-iditol 2-dehydrogenase